MTAQKVPPGSCFFVVIDGEIFFEAIGDLCNIYIYDDIIEARNQIKLWSEYGGLK